MLGFTHQLRYTNSQGQNATFLGYTIAEFKTRHVDPQSHATGPLTRHDRYTRAMNNDLMDLGQPAVQRALTKALSYARDAVTDAAAYFAKRPGGVHRYADMAKIFERHFKTDAPTTAQRDEVQRVLQATAKGLNGHVVISDLFAAKDGDVSSGLVEGAEGQVALSADEDAAFMRDARAATDDEARNDVMRQHLATSADAQIFVAFALMKSLNVAELARVIVHEATHKFAFTADYAYHSAHAQWSTLTAANAIKNADSYAYAAVSVKSGHAQSPDKLRRAAGPLLSMQDLRTVVPSMKDF